MQNKDKETFRALLREMRRRLEHNVSYMQQEALNDGGANLNELSDLPLEHLADRGSDAYMKDLMLGMIQDNEAELIDIDRALEKIDQDAYGKCEGCAGLISTARLKAIPFARLCIDCKKREERKI